jgi:hypothetical protein
VAEDVRHDAVGGGVKSGNLDCPDPAVLLETPVPQEGMAVARRGARTKVDEISAAILGVVGSRHRRQSIRLLGFGPRAGGEKGRPGIFRFARRSSARLVFGARAKVLSGGSAKSESEQECDRTKARCKSGKPGATKAQATSADVIF